MTEQQEQRLKQLRAIWEQKSTEELLAVWKKNDRTDWTDDTFEVIRQILIARLGDLPPQGERIISDTGTASPNHMARIAAYIGARKRKVIIPVAIIGILLLCGYVLTRTAWSNSDCGLSPGNLGRKVSVEEAEAKHTSNGVPFGYINDAWQALKAKMIFIDELWTYVNHGVLSGNDGYVVIRLGVPVGCIATVWY